MPGDDPKLPDPGGYGIDTKDFLERALIAATEWTRHGDAKVLAVLVLLGLGSKDMIDHAGRLFAPHEPAASTCDIINVTGHTCGGLLAASAAITAGALAGITVVLVMQALFPRLRMRGLLPGNRETGPISSLFYFGEVSRFNSHVAYQAAVKAKKPYELLDDLAGQVYEVAKVAAAKHRATRRAYVAVFVFLGAWAVARIALAMT